MPLNHSLFALALAVSAIAPAAAAQSAHEVIGALPDRFYVIGETTGDLAEFDAALHEAAAEIGALIDAATTESEAASLVLADGRGRTPLRLAASYGYAPLVEALLQSPTVIRSIDERDDAGLSAWDHAILAQRQSIWACRSMFSLDPFAWIPLVVSSAWYQARDPYSRIRQLLERAGAPADVERPRTFWLERCDEQSAATRTAVASSTDLQATLLDAGADALAAGLAGSSSPADTD